MTSLVDAIRDQSRRLGFLACGVADLAPSRYAEAFDRWLGARYAGTMRYLHRQARKRQQPAEIVPGAKVAVVVLENYLAPERRRSQRPAVRVAKYARGEDYHRAMLARLEQLAAFLRARGARIAKPYVDAGPVPERELAQRAGLGWIGKNTMLIRPNVGSFFFIGVVFTDLDLTPDPPFETDHCGSCTKCLDACPTNAIVEPRLLDATRCISYLTIESRQPIPDTLVGRLEGWAFGCDICNDVCPWNVRCAEPTGTQAYNDRGDIEVDDPEVFERMDQAEFEHRFGDTPLERPGLLGMRRNWRAGFASLAKHTI